MLSNPQWSIKSDAMIFAVMSVPLKAPAPILETKTRPMKTAPAPANPPRGAHQGIDVMLSTVGSGLGITANAPIKNARIKVNDTMLASHGLRKEVFNWAFIEFPIAWRNPETTMSG